MKGEDCDEKVQKFNSTLKNRPGGVAGPRCTIIYGKSQLIERKVK